MNLIFVLFVSLLILTNCHEEKDQNTVISQKAPLHQIVGNKKTAVEEIDLNGDGTVETIRFDCTKRHNAFSLFINDVSVRGRGSNLDGHYKIADIDTTDNMKEVAISEYGPSDDYATQFYCYDGEKIISMGKIPGFYDVKAKMIAMGKTPWFCGVKIDGSGMVATRARGKVLHTWFHPDFYRLAKDHTLEHIEQDLYPMNWRLTVKETLPLQRSRDNSETVVILMPGEKVTILYSDNKEWCFVENSKGIKGWFAVDRYSTIRGTGKDARFIFEGLSFAD